MLTVKRYTNLYEKYSRLNKLYEKYLRLNNLSSCRSLVIQTKSG